MSEKKRHKMYSLRELYDYILNRNGIQNRHRIERDLQQDPFLEDALEGFSELEEDEATKLVTNLNARIGRKSGFNNRNWITGIAATVALLIIAGIGYMAVRWVDHSYNKATFTLEQPLPDKEIKLQPSPKEQEIRTEPEITLPTPDPVPETSEPERPQIIPSPAQKSETKQFTEDEVISADEEMLMKVIIQEEAIAEEIYTMPSAGAINQQAPQMALSRIQEPSESLASNIVKGKIVDSESGEPLPGVSIKISDTNQGTVTDIDGIFEIEIPDGEVKLTASFIGMMTEEFSARDANNNVVALMPEIASLSEVVVIGYSRTGRSAQVNEQKKNEGQTVIRDPEPIGGYHNFHKYLKKNTIISDSETINRITIIVRFDIDRDGNPINFEVVESQFDEYSQKAEKLIKDGPRWIPAQLNGEFITKPVELKIDFRK
jgi:hypothetical protein